MTNQEANWYLDTLKLAIKEKGLDEKYIEAIGTLEQQPCEDCISRQAILKLQYRIDDSATLSNRDVVNVEDIEDLPSVQPKSKTGHWKFIFGETKCCYSDVRVKCNICGHIRSRMDGDILKYCPNCGAKMIEQKSEE